MRGFKITSVFFPFSVALLLFCFLGAAAKEVPFTQEDRDRLIRLETKIDEMEKRFEQRFEQIEQRFEQMERRFEQTDKRIEREFNAMFNYLWMLVVIFAGVTGSAIGFAIWDRRTMIRPFETKVKTIEQRIDDLDSQKVQKLLQTLRELSKTDTKVAKALKAFGLL